MAHVVYSFKAGGLENVIVQLINRLPTDRFRHVVIALTECSAEFAQRVTVPGVEFISLHKPPGQIFRLYPRLWRLLRQQRPAVLHTCNLAALEVTPVAWAAGVPLRVHAEHGWIVADPDGRNPRFRLLRRVFKPFVSHFIAVSRQLQDYLTGPIGVAPGRVSLLANGVDTDAFRPRAADEALPAGWPFGREHWVLGTVGRLDPVKNQKLLLDALAMIRGGSTELGARLRLVIVGEGGERAALEARIAELGLQEVVWLPGSRSDVAQLLRAMDCFALPSIAEGTSCTLQEAMASGLPIIATSVGGNPDLLTPDTCGLLVPSGDVAGLADAVRQVFSAQGEAQGMPARARQSALSRHSLAGMIAAYEKLFDRAR
ncbi:glycosyltransferase [Viridibacterium curvum]|uniref:Glycosyltransferase n=1 Tax=Viridibacterium curvum TaxID=1101404 RepID=A0ABP9QER6_9RHOO